MKRCLFSSFKTLHGTMLALVLTMGSLLATPVLAQTDEVSGVRNFPKSAVRGLMVVKAPPDISLNGKPDRLSPGARIRNSSNHFMLSGALLDQELLVNYTRDSAGLVYEVWVLTPEEAKEKRAGLSSRSFIFSSETEAAPQDDGLTPYNQLPLYKQ